MKYLIIIFFGLIVFSCNSKEEIKSGITKENLKLLIGEADSIITQVGIPDVYTNKIIKMESWYYGKDTVINFADDKVQNIIINSN